MKITFTNDEIYQILIKAMEEKTNFTYGDVDKDFCFIRVYDIDRDEIEFDEVEFTAEFCQNNNEQEG